jgi:hypothetical protein
MSGFNYKSEADHENQEISNEVATFMSETSSPSGDSWDVNNSMFNIDILLGILFI